MMQVNTGRTSQGIRRILSSFIHTIRVLDERGCLWHNNDKHNNNDAVITARPLQEVTRFSWYMSSTLDERLVTVPSGPKSGAIILNWLIEQGLTSHQTHYRSYRGQFLQVIWPNQQCQSTEGNQLVLQIRAWIPPAPLHHVTIKGNRLYAWRKGPNVTNPICSTCKNCSHEYAADCEHCVTQPST